MHQMIYPLRNHSGPRDLSGLQIVTVTWNEKHISQQNVSTIIYNSLKHASHKKIKK